MTALEAALDRLAQALRPHPLPDGLVRFWRRFDLERLPITLFPELHGPSLALTLYRENRAAFPHGGPPLLVPIAYSSHVFRSVDAETGEVWQWAWDEDDFLLAYPGLSELGDAVETLVARGVRGPVPIELETELRLARYGEPRRIACAVDGWPPAWLAASGIDLRDREPLGSTHAISSLEGTRPGTVPGPVRIAGVVVRLAGVGDDFHLVVDDGTGTLAVRVPGGTSPWLPVHGRRFELDVSLDGEGATATAVRPLD